MARRTSSGLHEAEKSARHPRERRFLEITEAIARALSTRFSFYEQRFQQGVRSATGFAISRSHASPILARVGPLDVIRTPSTLDLSRSKCSRDTREKRVSLSLLRARNGHVGGEALVPPRRLQREQDRRAEGQAEKHAFKKHACLIYPLLFRC